MIRARAKDSQLLPSLGGNGRRALFARLVACGLVQAASLGAAVWMTRWAVDGARAGDGLAVYAAGLVLAGLVTALGRIWEKRLSEQMGQLYVHDLRHTLLESLANMPASALAARRKGSLVLRYTGDLAAMRGWIGRGVVRIVVSALTLPALLAVLVLLSTDLAAAVGLVFGCGLALTWLLGPALQRRHHSARSRRGALSVRMAERVMQPLTLRFASSLPREAARLRRLNDRVIEESVRRGTMSAAVRAVPDAAAGLALALVVVMSARAVAAEELSIGGMVAAVAMVGLIGRPFRELAGVEDRRRAFIAARDRLLPILRDPRVSPGLALDAPPGIRLRGLALGDDAPGLTTTLPRDAGTLVLGKAGAGKTRLLEILAGLGPPRDDTARLEVGERAIDPAEVADDAVGYVSLRVLPFKGRVKALLRLRDPSLDDAECASLLRRAGAWSDLAGRGGVRARVAEGGDNLPLSLRLRLGLAIALAGAPKLLLVDDVELLGAQGARALSAIVAAGGRTVVIACRAAPDAALADACAHRLDLGDGERPAGAMLSLAG